MSSSSSASSTSTLRGARSERLDAILDMSRKEEGSKARSKRVMGWIVLLIAGGGGGLERNGQQPRTRFFSSLATPAVKTGGG